MSKKLYVGNLSYDADEAWLEDQFKPYGTIEGVKIITDRNSGRSKGFGFVEMPNDEEANAAIEKLNGTQLMGRNIVVAEARPKKEGGGGGGGRRHGGRPGGFGGGGGGGYGGGGGGYGGGGGGGRNRGGMGRY